MKFKNNMIQYICILLVITLVIPFVMADISSQLDRDKDTSASQSSEYIQETGGIKHFLGGDNSIISFIKKNLSMIVVIWSILRFFDPKNNTSKWRIFWLPLFVGLSISYLLEYGLHFNLNSIGGYMIARIFNPILQIPVMVKNIFNGRSIFINIWNIIVGNVYTILGLIVINDITKGKVGRGLKSAFGSLSNAISGGFTKEQREKRKQERAARKKQKAKETANEEEAIEQDQESDPRRPVNKKVAQEEADKKVKIEERTTFKELRETVRNQEIMDDIRRIEREYSLTKDKIELQRNLSVISQKIIREKGIKPDKINETEHALKGIYNSLFGIRIY